MIFRGLFSFFYFKRLDLDEVFGALPERPEGFADSGAFSAYSMGEEIVLDEYVEWLFRWKHLFSAYSGLDVIGDDKATWTNHERLVAAGLNPLPVFHVGEPFEALERYCEASSYVALGGMVPIKDVQSLLAWCAKCFIIGRRYGTRFHGFGQGTQKILAALPWYSADCSSWSNGTQFGRVTLWDARRRKFVNAVVGDHASVYSVAALIREHGGDPKAFASRGYGQLRAVEGKTIAESRPERQKVVGVNAAAWALYEAWLQRRHGEISAPTGYEGVGPKIYLAMNTSQDLTSCGVHLAEMKGAA